MVTAESTSKVKQLGNILPTSTRDNPNQGRVYDTSGLSPSITDVSKGGDREPMIVAMRGRNPDNPSDRTTGSPTEQRLEPNSQGICNTLTSVQKDNMVLENADFCIGGLQEHQTARTDGISPSLTAAMGMGGGQTPLINCQYRIRKLTPLECWRLMGFSDEDFLSAKLGNRKAGKEILEKYPHLGRRAFTEVQRIEKMSNSQLYKQAGNSIVKNVLTAIFAQLIETEV